MGRVKKRCVSLAPRAAGREPAADYAMLAQLGCGHVQGYGLARPMPLEEATDWITRHRARRDRIPGIGALPPR